MNVSKEGFENNDATPGTVDDTGVKPAEIKD
jgi:hypothetical protein